MTQKTYSKRQKHHIHHIYFKLYLLFAQKKINFLRTIVIEELKEAEITISQHKFEFVDYKIIVDSFDNNKQLTGSLKSLKFIFK